MQNLLFVTIDDFFALSAWPIYNDIAITPNMDAFQANSTNFDAAFADVALCNPSRAAILTGQTPWQTGVATNTQDLRHHVDLGTETLPGILKSEGVYTLVGGKVFHTFPSDEQDAVADQVLKSNGLRNSNSPEFDKVDSTRYGTTDVELSDDVLVDSATEFLMNYTDAKPFALFAGIYRPHEDWIIPQEYLDLYADIDIPLPDFVDDADRAEFLSALDRPFHAEVLDSGAWESLVRHYLASLTYADAKLGELLDGLRASGHLDNTITMVMSDHGYHLGDAELWHKFSTYEQSARAPLAIQVPGGTARQVDAPVNLSGVTATVLELLGIDVPAQMQPSLMSHINGVPATGDEFALTWMNASLSVRSIDYRYTLYENGEEELFDINADIMNVDNLIDDLPDIAAELRAIAVAEIGDDLFVRPDGPVSGDANDTTYYLHTTPVDITDAGGNDTVFIARDYALPEGLENLHGIEAAEGLTLTGNLAGNRITGAQDADTLIGRAGPDYLFGAAGFDYIDGGPGNDFVSGGPGADTLFGGSGNDRVEGNFGDDTVHGGIGNDELDGAQGDDKLYGGDGSDWLYGSAGNDRLEGGNGNDILNGGQGWDFIDGGPGTDTAVLSGLSRDFSIYSGNRSNFRIDGPNGRDTLVGVELLQFDDLTLSVAQFFAPVIPHTLVGSTSADVIETGRGDDIVTGRFGDDVIRTQSGDDLLTGGGGNDLLDGGAGTDTASYQSADGRVEVYLIYGSATGAAGSDTLIGIENLTGGRFGDLLFGDDATNVILGGRGNDFLRGNGGDDTLVGAKGNDRLEGGDGADILTGGEGKDEIFAGAGNDSLNGGRGNDWMVGGDGHDDMYGHDGNDTMFGGQHNDLIRGGSGDDQLRGNKGEDRLLGESGNDNLRGGDGDDILRGQAGDDALFGEAGRDKLHGNAGNDTLYGGYGGGQFDRETDCFVFGMQGQSFGGFDRIHDFENGIDKLDFTRMDFTSFDLDVLPLAAARNMGKDTAIVLGTDYVVYIDNFTLADLDASDVLI